MATIWRALSGRRAGHRADERAAAGGEAGAMDSLCRHAGGGAPGRPSAGATDGVRRRDGRCSRRSGREGTPTAGGPVRARLDRRRGLVHVAVLLSVLLGAGCGLVPVRRQRVVRFAFEPPPVAQYSVDPADSTAVFRVDGVVVRTRYLTRQQLNAEYAEESSGRVNLNPFTYGTKIDNDLGYVPDRFTVIEVDVNNIGLARVGFDPRRARLLTDRGDRLRPWGVDKGDAEQTFEQYYRSRRGAGGNEEEWFRRRFAIAGRDCCRRDQPVYKGQRQRCKIVFDVLHPDVRQVRLLLPGLALRYDPSGLPAEQVDLEFPFTVSILGSVGE